jgi:hypothetical protein
MPVCDASSIAKIKTGRKRHLPQFHPMKQPVCMGQVSLPIVTSPSVTAPGRSDACATVSAGSQQRKACAKVTTSGDAHGKFRSYQGHIYGFKDALLRSMETRARMERLVPNIRVMYLENEGHILPPQTGVISEFLRTAAIRPSDQWPLASPPRPPALVTSSPPP